MFKIFEFFKKIPYIIPVLRNRHKLRKIYKGPSDLCIISNNCVGGVISHELGLRFFSPTVNMWFSNKDYIAFIEDLNFYLNSEVIEYKYSDKTYPVGLINGDAEHKNIILYFKHYRTFKIAKKKWEDRKKRINENIVYIFDSKTISEATYRFADLCRLNRNYFLIIYDANVCNAPIRLCETDNIKILNCPNPMDGMKYNFNGKRNIEQTNYVSFLNELFENTKW